VNPFDLIVFIEGDDDKRFFEAVIKPLLDSRYRLVRLIKWSQMHKRDVETLVEQANTKGNRYVFVGDINSELCVTAKKRSLMDVYPFLHSSSIFVVKREIESWYLAGAPSNLYSSSNVSTENVAKGELQRACPQRFDSLIDYKRELLRCFEFGRAKQRNRTFCRFIVRYCS
jgi:hypothetical protein